MKKSELKTGMRLTLRNGTSSIVLLNTSRGNIHSCIGICDQGTWGSLGEWDEDLNYYEGNQNYDIIKVENARCNRDFLYEYETIWEREKKPLNAPYIRKHNDGTVVYFISNNEGFGVGSSKQWIASATFIPLSDTGWIPLEIENWTSILIDEAKKRGLHTLPYKGFNHHYGWRYISDDNTLHFNGHEVFSNGVWISIPIPEYTLEQLKEKLGHEFTIKISA